MLQKEGKYKLGQVFYYNIWKNIEFILKRFL